MHRSATPPDQRRGTDCQNSSSSSACLYPPRATSPAFNSQRCVRGLLQLGPTSGAKALIIPAGHVPAGQNPPTDTSGARSVPRSADHRELRDLAQARSPNFSHAILKMVCPQRRVRLQHLRTRLRPLQGRSCTATAGTCFTLQPRSSSTARGGAARTTKVRKTSWRASAFFTSQGAAHSRLGELGRIRSYTVSEGLYPHDALRRRLLVRQRTHPRPGRKCAHTGSSAAYADKSGGENARQVDEQMYYLIAGCKFKGQIMPVIRFPDVFNGKQQLPARLGRQSSRTYWWASSTAYSAAKAQAA